MSAMAPGGGLVSRTQVVPNPPDGTRSAENQTVLAAALARLQPSRLGHSKAAPRVVRRYNSAKAARRTAAARRQRLGRGGIEERMPHLEWPARRRTTANGDGEPWEDNSGGRTSSGCPREEKRLEERGGPRAKPWRGGEWCSPVRGSELRRTSRRRVRTGWP